MPTTKGSKMPKMERVDKKKSAKDAGGVKNGEVVKKLAINETTSDHCVDCGKAVLKTQQGLTCDGCGFWHHCECEEVSDEIYEFLCENCDEDSQIAWYCKKCSAICKKLTGVLLSMHEQQRNLEDKIEDRMTKLTRDMQKRLEEMEHSMSNKIEEKVGKIVESVENHRMDRNEIQECVQGVGKISKQLDEQRTDKMQIRGCIQEAVQVTLKEDKDEEEEQLKRSASVIIHGLHESKEEDPGKRMEEDAARIMAMAAEIKAEDIKCTKIIRLGKRSENDADKPRALKVVLESEEQKIKLLKVAKNLRSLKEKGLDKVFIQQDYTRRQQEKRKSLVAELKERLTMGETNLIIVDWKIVKKRT